MPFSVFHLMKLLFFFTRCDRHSTHSRLGSPIGCFISIKWLFIFWDLNLSASSLHTATSAWPLPLYGYCWWRFSNKCLDLRYPTKQQPLHTLHYSRGLIICDLSIWRVLRRVVISVTHFLVASCHCAKCSSGRITRAAYLPGVTQRRVGNLSLAASCTCWSPGWKSTKGFFVCCWSDHISTFFIILLIKSIWNMSLEKPRGALTTSELWASGNHRLSSFPSRWNILWVFEKLSWWMMIYHFGVISNT